jgi:putative ABC transport system permease protein
MSASTLGQGFTQVAFRLAMSPALIGGAIIVALVIGFLGGFFPGLRAATQKPLIALNAQ